jgi:hypothetical protein
MAHAVLACGFMVTRRVDIVGKFVAGGALYDTVYHLFKHEEKKQRGLFFQIAVISFEPVFVLFVQESEINQDIPDAVFTQHIDLDDIFGIPVGDVVKGVFVRQF